jgi:DNA repair photolyase
MALRTTGGGRGGRAAGGDADEPLRGRGATLNLEGRFESWRRETEDDGWARDDDVAVPAPVPTQVLTEVAKTIIARNDSPDIGFDQSINPYRGCEHGCVYCMDGDTAVLLPDGRTRRLADLRVGDEIVGTRREGHYRRFQTTRVLAHWRTRKAAWRILLADGTELIASADHRFLTERGWKYVAPSGDGTQRPVLTTNNSLLGPGYIAFVEGDDESEAFRRGYLAGIIRGDGHLASYRYERSGRLHGDQHKFRLALVDAEALDRSSELLASFGIGTDRFLFHPGGPARKPIEAIRTSARAAVERIRALVAMDDRRDREWGRGFVSGLFDAEGSFSDGALRIANTDPVLIDAARLTLREAGFDVVVDRSSPRPNPVSYVRVRGGLREHLRFFRMFRPAIARKCAFAGRAVKCVGDLRVVSITALPGVRDLYDITTGTEDFIANGVVSHNCYARPAHAYVGLSPGIDFETRIFAKPNAAELLVRELGAPGYVCRNIQIGGNTDPYQQAERELKITRSVIEVLARHQHPFSIITKNALIERDIDLMAPMAAKGLVRAYVSVTNWDPDLARKLEPRASAPWRRIEAIRRLAAAGIPTGVMVAPIIPFVTDRFMEEVLERASEAGASGAGYVLLRLPHEIEPLWEAWLAAHYPLKAKHVMSLVRQTRGGKAYDSRWGVRQRGTGAFADLIEQRFRRACERLGLDRPRPALDTSRFTPPAPPPRPGRVAGDDRQLDLF